MDAHWLFVTLKGKRIQQANYAVDMVDSKGLRNGQNFWVVISFIFKITPRRIGIRQICKRSSDQDTSS